MIAHQKAEEGGLALSVPADEAEPPVRIQCEGYIFKDIIKAAFIGEGQVRYTYFCHIRVSFPR